MALAQEKSKDKIISCSKSYQCLNTIDQPAQDQKKEGQQDSKRRNNKRMRRTAQEIQRKYTCNADMCDRCYGSQGSLQQHIKLKHPQMYKKQSESNSYDQF